MTVMCHVYCCTYKLVKTNDCIHMYAVLLYTISEVESPIMYYASQNAKTDCY